MVKYELSPTKSVVEVDLNDAFKGSSDMESFITNSAIEAQTAILAIIAKMVETIDFVCGKGMGKPGMGKKDLDTIKEMIISIACEDVDLKLLNDFIKFNGAD